MLLLSVCEVLLGLREFDGVLLRLDDYIGLCGVNGLHFLLVGLRLRLFLPCLSTFAKSGDATLDFIVLEVDLIGEVRHRLSE